MAIDLDSYIYLDRFKPKEYQLPLFDAIENKGYKRVLLIWPRRAGKDIAAFNLCIREALRKRQVIWYIFPEYKQGKRAIWDGITTDGMRVLDYIPPECIFSKSQQEMKITFINGSILQVLGSDNYNSLVGANPQLCIFSEYALQDPRAFQFISPILRGNQGKAVFLSTVRGKNHLYALYNIAINNPEWYVEFKTVDDTKHMSLEEIERDVRSGEMSADIAQQEYWNNWTMGIDGSFFGHILNKIKLQNQIDHVPYELNHKVHTAWDLGWNDYNVIIFFQVIGHTIRVIDLYYSRNEALDHYARLLFSKPYAYGTHFAPFDIDQHQLGNGITRKQVAAELGINFEVLPRIKFQDGIEAARIALNKSWIDEKKCERLLQAFENYRREFIAKINDYSDQPVHDDHSHFADAFRYLAQGCKIISDSSPSEAREKAYIEAMYGDQLSNLPPYHPLRTRYDR